MTFTGITIGANKQSFYVIMLAWTSLIYFLSDDYGKCSKAIIAFNTFVVYNF